MQISLKAFLLKKNISSVKLCPSPTPAKKVVPLQAMQIELNAQEYANESIAFYNNLFLLNTIRTSLKKQKKS